MWKDVRTGKFRKGERVVAGFRVPNIFERGYYLVSPGVVYSDAKRFYDRRSDFLEFFARKDYPSGGVVNPDHGILINKR